MDFVKEKLKNGQLRVQELNKIFQNLNQEEFHFQYYSLYTEHALNKIPVSRSEFTEKFDLKYEQNFNSIELNTTYDFVVMQKVLVHIPNMKRMKCIDKINDLLNPKGLFYIRINGQEKPIDSYSSEYRDSFITENEIKIIKSKFTLINEQKTPIRDLPNRFYYDFLFRKID